MAGAIVQAQRRNLMLWTIYLICSALSVGHLLLGTQLTGCCRSLAAAPLPWRLAEVFEGVCATPASCCALRAQLTGRRCPPDAAHLSTPLQKGFEGVVRNASGFEYRAERPGAAGFVAQKWSWSGYNPGARLAGWLAGVCCASRALLLPPLLLLTCLFAWPACRRLGGVRA